MKKLNCILFSLVFITLFNLHTAAQVIQGDITISIDCEPGKVSVKDANGILICVTEVKFYKWFDEAGFNLATAKYICQKNNWALATAAQVNAAHTKIDQLAYGMLADGSFAVPVNKDYEFFKKGGNIGAKGGNEGFFYVVKSEESNPQSITTNSNTGGSLNINVDSAPTTSYVPNIGGPASIVAVQMAHCSPSASNTSSKNWLIEKWPNTLNIHSTSSINIIAAKTFLQEKKFPVNDLALEQLVAAVKNDPVARYKFAPFYLKECFEALLTPTPNDGQNIYKAAFQEHQSCVDYNRAVITLDLWNNYQGQGSFGGPQAYAPNLLSNVNFSHRPSVDQFLQSDPAQYGAGGGEAVAMLFLPMAANAGLLDDHPSIEHIRLMEDDLTGIAAGVGLGSGVTTASAILGSTVGFMAVVGAKVTATLTGAASANLAAANAHLAYLTSKSTAGLVGSQLVAHSGAVANASSAVQTATTGLAKASAGISKTLAINASNLTGPVIVIVMAAVILGMTAAKVAKTDAYEAKVRADANRVHNFRVSDFLNVPASEMEVRKNALFVNVIKHLIASPAQMGKLMLEIPSILPKNVMTAAKQNENIGNSINTSATSTTTTSTVMATSSSGHVRIQNSWYKNFYIHNENGKIEQGEIQPNWWSSQWKIVPVHSGWIRIQNKRKPEQYLHNQNGKLEVGSIQPNWASAMWKIIPVHSGWSRIQNSWYKDHYIHNQNGKIELGPIDNNWASAMWKVEFGEVSGGDTVTAPPVVTTPPVTTNNTTIIPKDDFIDLNATYFITDAKHNKSLVTGMVYGGVYHQTPRNSPVDASWYFIPTGDGYYYIYDHLFNKALTGPDEYYGQGAYHIYHQDPNGRTNAQWKITPSGIAGKYIITDRKHNNAMVAGDVADNKLYSQPHNNRLNAYWSLNVTDIKAPTKKPIPNPGSPVNVALNKATKQSSDFGNHYSKYAVDGNTKDRHEGAMYATTNNDTFAWWEVDLGANYKISQINIFNVTDRFKSRLKNLNIRVSKTPFTSKYEGQAFATNVFPDPIGKYDGNATGRYVRVYIDRKDYLNICEVQVMGMPE